MRVFLIPLFISFSVSASVSDPLLVSNKVQTDLDGTLSRLIPVEQFLVQVNTDIDSRTQRRVVEGETIVPPPEPHPVTPPPMPGFVPESSLEPEKAPVPPTRQTYRLVELPELKTVRVSVSFDDALAPETVLRAKNLIRVYLQSNYPGKASLTFATLPMLKPEKEKDREPQAVPPVEKKEEKSPEKPLSEADILWNYARWAGFALLTLIALGMLRSRQTQPSAPVPREPASGEHPWFARALRAQAARNPWMHEGSEEEEEKQTKAAPEEIVSLAEQRQRVLERFLARSQSFRQYFIQLSSEGAGELAACLKGSAFDQLLAGLALTRPTDYRGNPSNMDKILFLHEKDFDEFVRAHEWQDRQFFGFMQNLTDEQLATLVASQPPAATCLLLRMMRPNQSASALDSMSPKRRKEVLSYVDRLQETPFSDLVALEKQVRSAAQQLPNKFLGSRKENLDFWGNVISESTDQETLFHELEEKSPEIAPALTKYRFNLDQAASLPDSLLAKVLNTVDNEELCLALATVSETIRQVFFDALSSARRHVLVNLFHTYRTAPRDRTVPARLKLTKRIREGLA